MMNTDYKRHRILDCKITRADMPRAIQWTIDRLDARKGGYVCFSNVHTVVTARKDARLRDIINNSFLSLPDGKPLSVVSRLQGVRDIDQVAGPDFMPLFIQRTTHIRHFFYGSTPETLEKLQTNLARRFPHARFVGSYSPPFKEVSSVEMAAVLARINQAKPDVIWVGLGAPKQEYWMAEYWQALKPAILMGVGAAFDFHAGKITRAPQWMSKLCIEWLFRLCQEPQRLWKRYLVTNSLFFYYLIMDTLTVAKRKRG
jgi:exopolysaccharide biosynthesis WecB/TagA/CpsF family protein